MNTFEDYIFPENIRFLHGTYWFALVTLLPLWLFSAGLLIFAFIHFNDAVRYLMLALMFAVLAGCTTHRDIAIRGIVHFKYFATRYSVGNASCKMHIENTINLNESYYVTRIVSEIISGKGAVTKLPQVLFSQNPFPRMKDPSVGGIIRYRRLAEQHIVFIPLDNHTGNWLAEELKITEIPKYPEILCKKPGTGSVS